MTGVARRNTSHSRSGIADPKLLALLAAGDVDERPCREGGFIGQQPENCLRDFIRLAASLHGYEHVGLIARYLNRSFPRASRSHPLRWPSRPRPFWHRAANLAR